MSTRYDKILNDLKDSEKQYDDTIREVQELIAESEKLSQHPTLGYSYDNYTEEIKERKKAMEKTIRKYESRVAELKEQSRRLRMELEKELEKDRVAATGGSISKKVKFIKNKKEYTRVVHTEKNKHYIIFENKKLPLSKLKIIS